MFSSLVTFGDVLFPSYVERPLCISRRFVTEHHQRNQTLLHHARVSVGSLFKRSLCSIIRRMFSRTLKARVVTSCSIAYVPVSEP